MCEGKVLNSNSIIKVDKSGLEYIDDSRNIKYIDFDKCRENWVEYINESDEFSKICNLSKEDSVCVGWRDICGNPPYIEFFSNPRVKFIFPYRKALFKSLAKIFFNNNYNEFSKIQKSITENVWKTFDLS